MTKGERSKRKIFSVAIQLFIRKGYDNVTVDEIVEQAQVAKGTFYIYFPTKAALIAYLFSDYDYLYTDFYEELDKNEPAQDQLLSMVRKVLAVTKNDIGYDLTRIAYQYQLENHIDSTDLNRPLYAILTAIIAEGQQTGQFNQAMEPEFYSQLLVRNLRGLIYEWCMMEATFDILEQGSKYMDYLIRTIL